MKLYKTAIYILVIFTLLNCTHIKYEKYENGTVKSKITIDRKGNYHGKSFFYYPSGNLEQETIYKHGEIKYCKVFYETGELLWEVPYRNYLKEGLYMEYYKSGEIKKEVVIKKGTIVSYNEFDSLKVLISEYRELIIDSIPNYSEDYITVSNLYTDSLSQVKVRIPGIPPSQIRLRISNGMIRTKDIINGIWEAKARNMDSVTLYLNLTINDSTEIYWGRASFMPLNVE